ncbi:MAG: C69 family dipeptidase [Bacteroidales bacterium]|nr:C69 family dipeptidase [Bacteroidales bacterium]
MKTRKINPSAVFFLSLIFSLISCSQVFSQSCDTWVAISNSTKDGSVIMGKNSDRPSVESQPLEFFSRGVNEKGRNVKCTHIEIPQTEESYAHIGSKIWWTFGYEHGLNEWGVAIGNEAEHSKEPYSETGLLGMDFVRLALERGKTAYEAMHVIISLLEKYGQGGGCHFAGQWDEKDNYHNSFIIADPEEAWVLETAGKYWVAKKVEDVWAISNAYSIESDYNEAHPDLVNHAIEMGWCKSKEDFNFAYCYSDPSYNYSTSQNRVNSNLAKLKDNKGNITVEFMMNEINRDHFDGTIEKPKWSPAHSMFVTTCMHDKPHGRYRTAASMVVHLRKDMPSLLGQVYWGSFSSPCVNVFKPFYFTGQTVPDQYGVGTNIYSEESPWWLAEKTKRLCDLNYNKLAPVVKGVFSETEKWELARSKTIESEVLGLLKEGKNKEAEKVLQEFSLSCVTRVEKEYNYLHNVLEQMIPETGIDYMWTDFLRENCKTNGLVLPGL